MAVCFQHFSICSHMFPSMSHIFSIFLMFANVFPMFFRCSQIFPYFAPKACHVFQRIPGSSRPLILFGHSRGAAPATCVAYRQPERVKLGPGTALVSPGGFTLQSCDSPVWKKSNFLIFKVNYIVDISWNFGGIGWFNMRMIGIYWDDGTIIW